MPTCRQIWKAASDETHPFRRARVAELMKNELFEQPIQFLAHFCFGSWLGRFYQHVPQLRVPPSHQLYNHSCPEAWCTHHHCFLSLRESRSNDTKAQNIQVVIFRMTIFILYIAENYLFAIRNYHNVYGNAQVCRRSMRKLRFTALWLMPLISHLLDGPSVNRVRLKSCSTKSHRRLTG